MQGKLDSQLREALNPLIDRSGQNQVADAIGMSSHVLGRWRKGMGTLTTTQAQALFSHFGLDVELEVRYKPTGFPDLLRA